MRQFFLSIILLVGFNSFSQHYLQHPDIKVDTSFNIKADYKKQVKNFPNIKPVGAGDTSKLVIKRDMVYATWGTRQLHLDVTYLKKNARKKCPVILFVHGGGWRSGDKSMNEPLANELSRQGFTCVNLEYRLSDEAKYPAGLMDLKSAIRWVKFNADVFPVDTSRFALIGFSSGGQMVSLIGSINGPFAKYEPGIYKGISDKVQMVIDVDGVQAFLNPLSSEGTDKPGKPSAATLWFNTTLQEDSASRIEASALTHVNPGSAQFLYLCSSIPRFHAGRDEMIAKLNEYHIKNATRTFENTPHTFWLYEPWFSEVVGEIVRFAGNK